MSQRYSYEIALETGELFESEHVMKLGLLAPLPLRKTLLRNRMDGLCIQNDEN